MHVVFLSALILGSLVGYAMVGVVTAIFMSRWYYGQWDGRSAKTLRRLTRAVVENTAVYNQTAEHREMANSLVALLPSARHGGCRGTTWGLSRDVNNSSYHRVSEASPLFYATTGAVLWWVLWLWAIGLFACRRFNRHVGHQVTLRLTPSSVRRAEERVRQERGIALLEQELLTPPPST